MQSHHEIRIGPAGWSYTDWEGIVYPLPRPRDFRESTYLAQFFDTIEINTSFYQPVRPTLAEQWIDHVSANPRFQFTAKLWQKLTHGTDATEEDVRSVRDGFDVLRHAGRLGAVLMQFPFSFHNTPENLARIERLAEQLRDYPLVVEVRHSSWNDAGIESAFRSHGLGLCNIDQPVIGRSVRPSGRATSEVGYVRLHGRRYDTWLSDDPEVPRYERYNYLYNVEELRPWAGRIKSVAARAKSTFVITNNHYEGKGVVNALDLLHLLGRSKVKVPEPLREHYPRLDDIADEPAQQGTLFPFGANQRS
ncbi:MAG: DUF72 domain-containing protein [Candidatus Acidiferrales bacterium]